MKFGFSPPPLQLHSVLWSAEACSLYTLTSSSISKWRVNDDGEQQVLSWDVQRALSESIADAIWVSARTRPVGRSVTQAYVLVLRMFPQHGLSSTRGQRAATRR